MPEIVMVSPTAIVLPKPGPGASRLLSQTLAWGDDQDKPVIGAEIMIGDSPEEGMVMISQDGSKEPIVTDAEGRFDLAVAPGARVLLAVDMKSPRPLAVQRFTVESGKDVELGDLHPPEGGPGSGAGSGSMVVEED